jgi:signal transduction histidine kinase/ligand-binding sensor domain-containing protein
MSMAFGADGRIWAGTQDGAAWYDGRDWNPMDMPGREVSNYVEAVLPRADGTVFFGRQDGGIACWREGAWSRYTRKEGLPVERVNALAETTDDQGARTLWAGTFGGGLCRLEGNRWVPWSGRGEVPTRIWRLIPSTSRPGALWVCGDQGAALVQGGVATPLPDLGKVSVNAVLESRDEGGHPDLWISTFGRGVARLRDGRLTFLTRAEGLPSDLSTDLAETRSLQGGRVIWCSTVGGLVRWEADRLQVFDSRWGLPTDTVYRLRADPYRADGLWIGTHGAGILYYRDGGWLRHDALSGLPGNIVLSLAPGLGEGREASVLAGTNVAVARWQGGCWTAVPIPEPLKGNRINALAEVRGRSGRPVLWVGSLRGLGRLEGGRWTLFEQGHGLPNNQVIALLVRPGATEDVWVGTQGGGLAHRVNDTWTYHSTKTGLPSDFVVSMAESPDADGGYTLWVGLRGGGLARYRKGTWRYWNRDRGFPNNVVGALRFAQTPAGPRLWVGTQGRGLIYADPSEEDPTFHLLEEDLDELLPSRLIYQIVVDGQGRIYASTPQGVLRLVPRSGKGYRMEQYTDQDGMPSVQCTSGLTLDRQGHLWVGTILGAGELDPGLPDPKEVPRPLSVSLFGTTHRELTAREVELPSASRSATFVSTLCATPRPDTILVRTQLEGFEEQPSTWTRERSREFLNLPAGHFTFLLWAREGNGPVLGPQRMEVRILPAFWETWTFRLVGLAAVLMLGFAFVRWRMGAVNRRNIALESLVAERTHDLGAANENLTREVEERVRAERLKDEFVSVVSHELRTPLTSIRGALGLLKHGVGGEGGPEAQNLVQLAERNSLRLLALVNDLLDIQKIEAGQLPLTLQHLDLREVAQQALETYGSLAATQQVRLQLVPGEGALAILGDPARLEQVFANLLSNATKFSPKGATVWITLADTAGFARVAVTNEGAPIPDAFRSRIFQKFAQADGSSTRAAGGTGLGLAITKALVEAHQGTIGFQSDANGTVFWFELPLIGEIEG